MKVNPYRIQKRKYSSNVIERLVIDKNGKSKWKFHLCPSEKKSIGDVVVEEILIFLNGKEEAELKKKIIFNTDAQQRIEEVVKKYTTINTTKIKQNFVSDVIVSLGIDNSERNRKIVFDFWDLKNEDEVSGFYNLQGLYRGLIM